MKSQLICLCAVIQSFIGMPVFAQVSSLSQTNYGIWQSFGDPVSSAINPEVRGRLCNFNWADLEPVPDKWQWKSFDSSLTARAADGLPIIFMVYTEESAPEWIYSNGVPKVAQKDNKGNFLGYAPYYADADYKFYFGRMIKTVREHVEKLPATVRNQIIAVQACLGSTGDYISYKGDVDPQYRISNADFYTLFQEFSQVYYEEYRNTNPKIALLSNPKNNGPDQATWLFTNCPGGWIKTGSLGKGFQLNDELSKSKWLYPMINLPILNGEYVRARSEIIGGTTSAGWWNRSPYKNMFALMCYDIAWGLDWSNQGYDQISDKAYDSAFGFFNKYAGEKDATKSAYAMCALRDGLDAADDARFSAAGYGSVSRGNASRYINIANAHAAYGAKLEDIGNAMSDELNNLGAKGINDVGWDVFPGNYERFLHQIRANETSTGYWNIESADKKDMYGKFGRGFDLAKGKDALYFDVEDAFFNNAPLNSKAPVIVEITYLDNSNGSWQLFYDGAGNTDKPSLQVKGTNSKLWKKASVAIQDAYLGNRAVNGSDFYIKNTGTENIIFSLVEFRRPYEGEVLGLSASKLAPFSTVCTGGTSFQTLYVSGSFLQGGNAVVGPLKGFGFSIDSGRTYPDSVIIKDIGAAFSRKIFVKFNPDKPALYNGNIPFRTDNVVPVLIAAEASSVNSSPSLESVINDVKCNGSKDGAIELVCKAGIGPFTFNWAGPDYFWVTTKDISKLSGGTYTVSVKSQGGCVTKATFKVNEPDTLKLNASAPEIGLDQSSTNVTVTATGGTAPYSGTGNFTVGSGTYTYTITDANGCNANASVTVSQPQSTTLAAFAASKKIACHGGFTTVSITGTGGKAPYTGTGDFIVSAGTYNYSVTDANGTVSSVTVTVHEPPALNASVTAGNILCNGGNANIMVSATGGVAPYTGTGNFTAGAGVHTYPVTDANGCPAVKTVSVTEPSVLSATMSAASINCNGGTSIVAISAAGGIAPYTNTGNFTAVAGTHNYTITDANGCQVSKTINITQPPALNIAAKADTIPLDETTTIVAITATGGAAPYTGTGNFTVTAGNYNYTITDANGCQANTSVTVSAADLSPLKATAVSNTILCNGGAASVTVSATGGTAPYTGTGNYTVSAGTYTYTITDAKGKVCQATVTVTEPEILKITSISKADVSSCKNGSGSFIVTSSGGTMPYTYNLNAGTYQNSNEFTNLSDGNYTVIVKDSNGCISSAPAVITKSLPMKAWFNAINDVSNCGFADGSVTVTNEGGFGPYQYSINNGLYQPENVFTKLPENDYTITVKDSRGCETSAFTTIKRDTELTLSVSSALNVSGCSKDDGSIKVIAAGGGGAFQYCLNGQPYKDSSSFNGLCVGTYTITVKDWRGCSKSVTASLIKIPALAATIKTLTNASCGKDGAIEAGVEGGSGPYLYSINGGLYQPQNTFNNLSAGIYTVQVKDGRGCVAAKVAAIGAAQPIVITVEKTAISCIGGSDGTITITNTGGAGPFQYNIDSKAFSTRNVFGNLRAGMHTITVMDSRSCAATTKVPVVDGTENCSGSVTGVVNPDSVQFKVTILPNPSPTIFTLIISSNSEEKAEIIVTDMLGKMVFKAGGSAHQQYQFGNAFAQGMYIVRVIQGQQMQTLKVIKTSGQ